MLVSYDLEAGATYVELSTDDVARTATIGDDLLVDLDMYGRPVGVEFLVAPPHITREMIQLVVNAFPVLDRTLSDRDAWLLPAA